MTTKTQRRKAAQRARRARVWAYHADRTFHATLWWISGDSQPRSEINYVPRGDLELPMLDDMGVQSECLGGFETYAAARAAVQEALARRSAA